MTEWFRQPIHYHGKQNDKQYSWSENVNIHNHSKYDSEYVHPFRILLEWPSDYYDIDS